MNRGIAPAGYFEKYYANRDWRFYRRVLAIALELSEPGPILDVGAGVGFLVEAAQRWGLKCEGIDGSEEAVRIGRARFPDLRLRFHALSDPLPYGDESFQTVILNQVIEHLEAGLAEAVLDEIYRVLRPGGMALVASPSRFDRSPESFDPTHVRLYTPKELAELLGAAGFAGVQPFDSPRAFFGRSRLGTGLSTGILRLTGWQRLSASANCIAYKPSSGIDYWIRRANHLGARAVLNLATTAKDADRVTARHKRLLFPLLRRALEGSERVVLDFGCGAGRFTADLAALIDGNAIGIDPVPSLIDLAPRADPRIRFLVLDEGTLPLPDEHVDVIWICLVLAAIVDLDVLLQTVAELDRVLRPGGLLFVAELTERKPDAPYIRFRSVDEYRTILGFADLTVRGTFRERGERVTVLAGRKAKPASDPT
jgi:ubiquinone/menaquinone biosynthesis C-methylase UbiE